MVAARPCATKTNCMTVAVTGAQEQDTQQRGNVPGSRFLGAPCRNAKTNSSEGVIRENNVSARVVCRTLYWETITFVAALRHNKMVAPMVVEGAMTGEMFLAYVENCLVPTLRRNDIVVMDNCRVHLGTGIGRAIETVGATLRYLPKYSPDLNPIEMPYSKFKTFLRKVAARTIPSLNRAIRSFIPQLSPQECANYFRHAGYVSI